MLPRIAYLITTLFISVALVSPVLFAQCQPTIDCNQNGVSDQCDLDLGTSDDCNGNQIPDECDIESLTSEDCNLDGIPDECNPETSDLIGLGLAFGQGFGSAIDSSPQFTIVGAPFDDLMGTNTGSANIFRRIGTQWIEEMKIFGIAAGIEDRFGTSVAVADDLVAVGAPGKFFGRGAVYIYRRVGNNWWNYEGTVTAFDAQAGWAFGTSVDIQNEKLIVGATMTGTGTGPGAVYIFSQISGMWLLEHKLQSAAEEAGDHLGASVKLHGSRIAAGAPGRDAGGATNSGAVIIFEEAAGLWLETGTYQSISPQAFGEYGTALDMDQEHLLVGAPGEDAGDGAAYLYDRLSSMWINAQRLSPNSADEIGLFGSAVSLDVRTAAIGIPLAGTDQGNICLLRQENGIWNPVENLISINEQLAGDKFGTSISCQIPFLLVGCAGEDSGEAIWITAFTDCNLNLEDDVCDVTQGLEPDCNLNQIPDSCEIEDGTKQDCDGDGVPDECQISEGTLLDCNLNGVPDDCDISSGFSLDCNIDDLPDECQIDADPFHPVISNMPDPISVEADQDQCGAVVTWDPPEATDDCGMESLVSTHQPGSFFTPGLTIVTYTATDVSGNTSVSMFTVLVSDEQAPDLEGLTMVVTVQAPIDSCEAPASWESPTPIDNCGIFSITSSHAPGSTFNVGLTTVTYTVMDLSGNVAEFPFIVEVLDNHLPEIVGIPENVATVADPGMCSAVVEWTEPTPEDDCEIVSFLSTHQSGGVFPVGSTAVAYTVVDSSGLETTEEFTITVEDNQAPEFTSIPSSSTLGNDPDNCQAVVTWAEAAATDNCDIESITSTHQPGSSFSLGTTVVTVTAVDVNGNTTEHSFEITVNDTQLPSLVGVPGDMTVENDPAQCFSVVNWALPEISDNCSVASFSGTHDSGFAFPLGSTTVTYTLVDTSGNTREESFAVTVNDTEMPILVNMPVSITVPNDLGQCGANVDWDGPIPWDNCNLVDFDASHQPGSFFPVGTTTVNFLVMDGSGQITTSSFEIMVDDEETPKLNGMPADRTISTEAGLCSTSHDWTPPVPSDNCEVVSFTASHEPGDIFSVGTTEVSYSVEDSAGFVTADQFLITVIDTENPEIIRIPDDVTLLADQDECSTVVDWVAPDSQDNCGIAWFDITHASGSSFDVGTTTVAISTEDLHGNQTLASFTVEILDDQLPVFSGIPAPITAIAETGQCGTTISWDEPFATDNCQIVGLGSDHTSGDFFDVGTTVVTYSVSDPSGNFTEESFMISISDEEHPEFGQFEELILATTDPGICQATVTWDQPLVTDNCAVSETTSSHQPGDLFSVGDTVVDLLTTDVNGNETSASFTVSVFDLELPQIVGLPQEITAPTGEGVCDGGIVTWDEPTYTDNCSATGLGSSAPSGTFFALGTTIVTYSVVDGSGNENSVTISVTVIDSEVPVFTSLPGTVTGSNSQGLCSAPISWDPPSATDNCSVDTITLSHDSGQDFPVGDTVVTAVATDVHGNVTTEVFTVSVLDEEAPQFSSVPQNMVVENEVGQCGAAVNWIEPAGSDNCQAITIEADPVNGAFFEVGTTPVIFTISDTAGNVVTESFEITVVDQELPAIAAMPSNVTVTTDPGVCVAGVDWDSAEASDNCQILSFSSDFQSGDLFPVGTTTVVYTAQDLSDNIHTDSFQITVLDEELPEIHDLPANILVSTDPGACTAVVDWVQETSSDNCEVLEHISSHQPQDTFELGITTVDVSVSDINGNSTSASFTVTVNDAESPQLVGMPADATLDNEAGLCGATLNWEEPTSTDNCQASVPISDITSGSMFSIGTTVVTYSTEDPSGNTSTEIFTVTVEDVDAPVIDSMPADLEVVAPEGTCDAFISWIEPTATDCISHEISSDEVNGGAFPIGDTLVTYSATDPSGNTSIESFTITVLDQEQPAIEALPTTVQVDTTPGTCLGVATWQEPTASDCSGISSLIPDQASGTEFPVGSTEVTYTAVDGSGNTSTASFIVTVMDVENPQILGMPADATLDNEAGLCGATLNWEEPTSTDNCQASVPISDITSGSMFSIGTTVVTYSTEDPSGNISTEIFTVTVEDVDAPVIDSMPADLEVVAPEGSCDAVVSWLEPSATDCISHEISSDEVNGGAFPIGDTLVIYSATDPSGNTSIESFTITVLDQEQPAIEALPTTVQVDTTPGTCLGVATWQEPTASDCSGISSLIPDQASGTEFPVGSTEVTYTAVDGSGNTSTASFIVTVMDVENPQILGMPVDVTIANEQALCGATVIWEEPTSTDNCQASVPTSDIASGSMFSIGTTVVTYSTEDPSGNISTEIFTVTVEDVDAPVIDSMPADLEVVAPEGSCDAVVSWLEPSATDCISHEISSDEVNGVAFPIGDTLVTYSATDPSGNTSSASFTITVLDQEQPEIAEMPATVQVDTTAGSCLGVATWDEPTASDCSGILSLVPDQPSGTEFPVGSTEVTYTAMDGSGNTSSASFTVMVTDAESPQIVGMPADVTIDNEAGLCGATLNWEEPTSTDNCQASVPISDITSGSMFSIGTTVVTYSTEDPSGNTSTEIFTVTVEDVDAPVIDSMPADLEVVAPEGTCDAFISWIEPTATDCISHEISSDEVNGGAFPIGDTLVTYSATDPSGNTSSASFTITVLDQEQPEIEGLAEIVQVDTTAGSCLGVATWTEPTASDCSGISSLVPDQPSGTEFPVGSTEVTYTAIDGSGNTSSASFIVTVVDSESPVVIDLPADIGLGAEAGLCGAVATWEEPTSSDNCEDLGLGSNILSGSFFEVGTTAVTYSVSDSSGNLTEVSFLVTVEDLEGPEIEGELVDVIIGTQPGVCGSTHEWGVPDFLDNCGVTELVASHQPGDFFPAGESTVTYLVMDAAGHTAEASFLVEVSDLEIPQILTMPEDVVLENDPGVCGAAHTWDLPETSDNCVVSALVSSHQPGDIFPTGETTVFYTAQDTTGNIVSDQFTVIVNDLEAPIFNGLPAEITVSCDPGVCTAQVDWAEPVASDNCEILDYSISHHPGDIFVLGTSTVSLEASDIHGNQSAATFTVVVLDQEAPEITGTPEDITLSAVEGFCGAVAEWSEPVATDNCQQLGLSSSSASGSFFPVGSTSVIYSVSDPSGNATESSFTVIVTDDEAPTFTSLPDDFTVPTEPGICGAVVTWPEPSGGDNCAVSSLTLDMENGTYLDTGEYLVTAVVDDIHGNSRTDQFTIIVADMENPQLTGVFEDITLIADTGSCGTVATWEAPTTSDNCLDEILAVNYAPGTFFVTGTTEVRYVATDSSGNVHEEAFNVIVIDDQFPTIEGVPADIQVSNDPGLCTSVVDWIQETSSDNCSIGLHASTHQPGDAFELGTTVVGISVVDPSGNETTASFTVTVTDDENPQLLDMPADITIGTDLGSCGATVNWTEPTPIDNCEAIGMSSDIENGSFFAVGPTTVTYSLQDLSGNSITDSFVVFITEDEAPTITGLPADVVINVESGLCGASFDWVLPTISDNCTVAQESGSHLPGEFFPVGSTTVTYAAIDTAGNETSESFVVSVEDDEFPVVTGVPLDVALSSDTGVCGAVHEWPTPGVSDNCEIDSFLQTHSSGDLFPIGETTVQFTAEDLTGNITEQQFTITVVDDEAPEVLGVSSDIQIDTDSGACTAVVDWVSETSSDNCGVVEHSTSHQPGDVFELGTTIVEINVADVNGNVSTSSFAVTVTDNEVPLILDSPADISVETDEGVCGATIDWNEPNAVDNCQTVGLASDIQSGSLFEVGSTVVTYTVGDPSGNSAMVSFVVTITDGEAPTFLDLSADVSISAQEGVCGSVFDWTPPTITDNCQIATEESTHQPGDFFLVGITTVAYTATDDEGNSTSASFTVEVLDEEAPVIHGMPLDAVISVDLGICVAGHEWVEPSATDNCAVLGLGSDLPTGHLFELGSTVVTYTAEDSAGILTISQFTVTVVDDEAPVISSVPDRVLVITANNECTQIAEWIAPVAEDNCELVSFTSSHTSGEVFPAGDTPVFLVATDATGNVTEIEFLVTVTDIQIPSIVGLPSDFTVVTEPGICGAVVAWDLPFAVDNCGVEMLTSDIPSGSFMSPGVTTVTYTAVDVNGNILITGFDVTVVDLEFPEFITAPADVQLLSEPGLCDVVVEWAEVSATDNCGIESIESTNLSGDRFSLGITEVIIFATDLSGNVSNHSFSITVTDDELPLFTTIPFDITVENELSVCGALVSWEEPVALDNCTIESLISDHMSGDLFEVGDTSVTYVITDSSGNTADTTFVVTVLDAEAPQILGLPEIIEASTDVGECTATVSWDLPEITDNCLVVNTMSTHVPGEIFPIGDTVVTYSVSDSADLVTTIAFLVTVSDQEQPQINSMPSNMVVSNDPGICGADVSWISPTAVDNCGVSNLTSDIENSSFFALGTSIVTYTATDIHGNSIDASFDVIVEDQESPILHGLPVSIQIGTNTDLCGATATWAAPEAIDNCEVVDLTQTHISGDFFPVGETTVTYLVTDAAGNETSVSFAVQVTDVQGPVVTGLPGVIDAENTTGQCGTEVTWEEPTIEDACGEVTFNASHLSGEFFPVGDNEVAYTATDSAGNVTIATFIVSVRDTELPVITSVPENQVVVAPPGHCAAAVNWEQPTATDNCQITQLVTSFYSGMEYAVGTTTVIVVATDGGSNQVTASFQITVLDEEDPEIVGVPSDLTYTSQAGVCGAFVSWIEPSGIDGCGLSSFESSHDPDSFFSVGSTVVTYVATDTSGNSVSDNFTITILDVESPTITPPAPITVTAPEGDCSSFVEVPPLETEDACGPVEVVNDFNGTENASGVFPRGNTLINWSATDGSGNVSFTAGIVTVLVESPDCNGNNNPDSCDIATGSSLDCNSDGVPDECQPDCDGDGIPDECEIAQGGSLDCDEDGIPDECEISNGTEADCDNDGVIDLCEILSGTEVDCDQSGIPDSCELASGVAVDCNGNGQPDICDIASGIDLDCDLDGVADSCQISSGASIDCDQDGVIDSCELNSGSEVDCNGNGVPDSCDLATGQDTDCNDNQVPDVCDLASGVSADCNANGILDVCDLEAGTVSDCDGNFVPDNCEIASGAAPDCNTNGIPDSCDLMTGISEDCNGSGVPDSCEVASGATPDCNGNGIPDSCDIDSGLADCDGNGIPDNCDIGNGQVADCNSNGIPDQCDLASGLEEDCDGTGVPDSCEVFTGTASDCNMNGIPDSCDIASGVWADCDLDGDIDSCEIELGVEQDCNSTGIPDSCEISTGVSEDCNGNAIPDSCDLSDGTLNDCNDNTIPDACEISDGIAEDCNGNGIPDPCDIASGTDGDLDGDTIPDSCQVNFIRGDGNGDGIVNIADGVFLLVNLFAGGMNPNCDDAADANDDGSIDVSDVISILGFQFNGTSPPPPPFPSCGVDPTDTDTLGCASYNACP